MNKLKRSPLRSCLSQIKENKLAIGIVKYLKFGPITNKDRKKKKYDDRHSVERLSHVLMLSLCIILFDYTAEPPNKKFRQLQSNEILLLNT